MNIKDFNKLLDNVENAFNKSNIKVYCEENNLKWFYAICSTSITIGAPLIVGFNWGAAYGEDYEPQTSMPQERFIDLKEKRWLGSLSRIVPYLIKYFSEQILCEIGQTNYCFFRSATENQISEHDLNLCRPLFLEFLQKANPSYILSFSSKLKNYLTNSNMLNNLIEKQITFQRGDRQFSYNAAKATFSKTKTKIIFLPHPNYPITSDARRQAWEFCIK